MHFENGSRSDANTPIERQFRTSDLTAIVMPVMSVGEMITFELLKWISRLESLTFKKQVDVMS